jgi:hypothetical protein
MVKLIPIRFWQLPNSVHYAFFTEHFLPLLMEAGDPVLTALAQHIPLLNAELSNETTLMQWQQASEVTPQMAAADGRMDRSLTGIQVHLKAKRYSPDADTLAAVNRVELMLKQYGKVVRKPYETEVGNVKAILGRLQGDLAADVALLGLSELVSELQTHYEVFNTLFHVRSQQLVHKPTKSFPDTRKSIDGIYDQAMVTLEANAVTNPAPEFANFIARINPEIDYFNKHYRRKRRRSTAASESTPDAAAE